MTELIRASELQRDILTKKILREEESFEKKLQELNTLIYENKYKRRISVLSLSPRVVKALTDAGYIVKFCRAWHMGDMDTHEIEW